MYYDAYCNGGPDSTWPGDNSTGGGDGDDGMTTEMLLNTTGMEYCDGTSGSDGQCGDIYNDTGACCFAMELNVPSETTSEEDAWISALTEAGLPVASAGNVCIPSERLAYVYSLMNSDNQWYMIEGSTMYYTGACNGATQDDSSDDDDSSTDGTDDDDDDDDDDDSDSTDDDDIVPHDDDYGTEDEDSSDDDDYYDFGSEYYFYSTPYYDDVTDYYWPGFNVSDEFSVRKGAIKLGMCATAVLLSILAQ